MKQCTGQNQGSRHSAPAGSGGPGAGWCTADPWGPPDPVMPDTRSTRRGRLGGAGDTRGGRCPLLPASRAAPVPSRYFPCRTCSSPGWRSRGCLICSSAGKGLSSYCASPTPPGACLPAFCSLRRGEGEVTQGAAMWEKPPLHARSSLAPRVASPSLSCPPALPTPCRGAVGQGLPHGGAGTIW